MSFAGDSRDLRWRSVEPRIGLTYAIGADKKSLLRAAYNRYANQQGSLIGNANPLGFAYFTLIGNSANVGSAPQPSDFKKIFAFGGLDPANPGAALAASTRIDYGMKVPTTDELLIGFDRR